MTPASVVESPVRRLEDPLEYLPCSGIVEHREGHVIYDLNHPPNKVYLIIEGKVKVTRTKHRGRPVIVDIYQPTEFFGETAFLYGDRSDEQATAFESVKLMSWPVEEIEDLAGRKPRLMRAFIQLLVARTQELACRIESFSSENVTQRLARALLRFGERIGERKDDVLSMSPFKHEVLAQYVGTSREIVTQNLNQFRRDGFLDYTREEMHLRRNALVSLIDAELKAE